MKSVFKTVIGILSLAHLAHGQVTFTDTTTGNTFTAIDADQSLEVEGEEVGPSHGFQFGYTSDINTDWIVGGTYGFLNANYMFAILYKYNGVEYVRGPKISQRGGIVANFVGSDALVLGGLADTYFFENQNDVWNEVRKIEGVNLACTDINYFSCDTVSSSNDGKFVIMGDPQFYMERGRVRIYERNGDSWGNAPSSPFFDDDDQILDARYGETVCMAGGGDFAAGCMMGPVGTTNPNNVDKCKIFKRDGSTWSLYDTVTKANDADDGFTSPTEGNAADFGRSCGFTDDGSTFFVSHESRVYAFEDNGATFEKVQTLTPQGGPDPEFGFKIRFSEGQVFLSSPVHSAPSGSTNNHGGKVFIYYNVGAGWVPQQDYVLSPQSPTSGDRCGWSFGVHGRNAVVGCRSWDEINTNGGTASSAGRITSFTDIPLFPTPSPTPQPTPTPACLVSSDCEDIDEYCSNEQCHGPTACLDVDGNPDHAQCENLFPDGRVAFCHKTGSCRDILDGITCSSPSECNSKRARYLDNSNSVGKIDVVFGSNLTPTQQSQAAQQQIIQAKENSVTTADLKAFVAVSKEITLDGAYFEAVATESAGLDAIKSTVCGVNAEFCTVVITSQTGERRVLNTEYTVTVTYDVDDATFASIESNTAIDDPAFLTELATAAGVDAANVTVTATGGELTVTYVLVAESDTDEPLGDDVLQEIEDLEANLDNVTQTVISTLNITSADIESTTLDKCDGRDCNGFGADLCNSKNGKCNCPPGYWGINCDEICTCENGGTCPQNTCNCLYPYFGPKCGSTKTECSDGTCV